MNLVYNVRRLVQIDKLRASGVRYSQIDVSERVSSPRDWDLLYALESLTNPSRYPCTRVTAGEPQTAYVDA